MTCELSNDDGEQNYQWKKGTVLVLPTNDKYSFRRRGREFIINNVTVSDSGQYHCEVNINGEVVPSFEVQVTVKSEILTSRNTFDH